MFLLFMLIFMMKSFDEAQYLEKKKKHIPKMNVNK